MSYKPTSLFTIAPVEPDQWILGFRTVVDKFILDLWTGPPQKTVDDYVGDVQPPSFFYCPAHKALIRYKGTFRAHLQKEHGLSEDRYTELERLGLIWSYQAPPVDPEATAGQSSLSGAQGGPYAPASLEQGADIRLSPGAVTLQRPQALGVHAEPKWVPTRDQLDPPSDVDESDFWLGAIDSPEAGDGPGSS